MLKILVTRPRLFAESLCQSITTWGGLPLLFPTIEICPVVNPDLMNQQLQTLQEFDIAIFTSRPAALYGMRAIQKQRPAIPSLLFAAIGPGTAMELKNAGVSSILYPLQPPFESESLLSLPELQNVQNKKVMLFRGNEGRMLLYERLQERGATVTICETYRRTLPKSANIDVPDVVIVTSPQCLTNLRSLARPTLWGDLQQCPFITVGLRTYNLSATLGIRKRYMADGAEDTHLLQSLTQVRNDILKGIQ